MTMDSQEVYSNASGEKAGERPRKVGTEERRARAAWDLMRKITY